MTGFGKDGKGQILWDVQDISIGALAANDVISANSTTGVNLDEDFRILKTQYFFAWRAPDFSEAPILIGMAAGGLQANEIEEAIESTPNDTNDYPEIEQAMRPVWPLEGMMLQNDGTFADGARTLAQDSFNPKWTMPSPGGWVWWILNHGSAALTAGGVMHIVAKHFGVWVR